MVSVLQPGNPVYCLHPEALRKTARQFLSDFPGRTLYAVKCNPHPFVLRTLFEAGIEHFDAASIPEIAAVRGLAADATAYYMHPVKTRDAILTAHTVYGIRHFVIDHRDELAKILYETNDAEDLSILVRFATPGGAARYELSEKFGATADESADLLQRVREAGCRTGLAFHVGSQCLSPAAFREGVLLAGRIASAAGVPLDFLDVGGGFPAAYVGEQPPALSDFLDAVRDGVKRIGLPRDCVLMCQPGRALVAGGCSLVVQVQLRKESAIYINDGRYHSLSETVTGNLGYPVRAIRSDGVFSDTMRDFTVFGPTCDSTDVLPSAFSLPDDIREGDWIEIGQLGAYSNALVTRFNGIAPDHFVTIE